jgi:hypothetical protein
MSSPGLIVKSTSLIITYAILSVKKLKLGGAFPGLENYRNPGKSSGK